MMHDDVFCIYIINRYFDMIDDTIYILYILYYIYIYIYYITYNKITY